MNGLREEFVLNYVGNESQCLSRGVAGLQSHLRKKNKSDSSPESVVR